MFAIFALETSVCQNVSKDYVVSAFTYLLLAVLRTVRNGNYHCARQPECMEFPKSPQYFFHNYKQQ